MYLILIAWFYVTLMMAIAEATNPVGSVLGGVITFVLYGLLPMSIVGYILATPARKRRLQERRAAEQQAWETAQSATKAASATGLPASAAAVQSDAPPADAAAPHSPASPPPSA